MTSTLRLGIDLGGTKIEAAVIDGAGAFVDRRRVANPGSYETMLDATADLVEQCEAACERRFDRLGMGIPGSPSPATGLIRNGNSTWLNDRSLHRDLEHRLGRSVRLANDANCMALSEATDGAGRGATSVFGVILGTGCGGGLVIDGRLVEGRNGIAGEWGHIPLPHARPDEETSCWCGRRNCLETYLSGSGIERDFRSAGGEPLRAHEIIERARGGHGPASESLARHQDRLGRALSVVVNLIDPEVIVIAGGLSNAPEILDGAFDAMRPYVFSDVVTTAIRRADHGDSSGVRGAAWLWPL
jgi:fructokinase